MSALFKQVIKPAYLRARAVRSRLEDHRLGVVTADERPAVESYSDSAEYHALPGGIHRALPFTGIQRLMRRLDPSPSDALLDLGCGAGRVICVAAQHPFARVVGVEIDERVCALAARNARALRRFAVRPEVVCADAAAYRVPDDITVMLLYNSFGGEVLRSALSQVLESHDRTPRRVRLVYANPREHELVMSTGRFREAGRLWMSWRPGAAWARTQMMRFYEVERRL